MYIVSHSETGEVIGKYVTIEEADHDRFTQWMD